MATAESTARLKKPKLYDLYCGLGGWAEPAIELGYDVIGFDITRRPYPGRLVLQDVRTIHGAQLADADLIVSSSPCEEFSYRAMPWSRAKDLPAPQLGTELFWQAFRIQYEASEAAGRYIPLVAENVRGAERWIGPATWHFGSFYLWGDVPALMPRPAKHQGVKVGDKNTHRKGHGPSSRFTNQNEGVKQQGGTGAAWFDRGIASLPSRSPRRREASALIAKIPHVLARHIVQVYLP